MIGISDKFYVAQRYAYNYYLISPDAMQSTVRYGEIKGIVTSLSYNNKNAFTITPREGKYFEFKESLISFLEKACAKDELISSMKDVGSFLLVMRWAYSKEADSMIFEGSTMDHKLNERAVKYYKSIAVNNHVPIHEFPIEILYLNIDNFFDDEFSALEVVEFFSELYDIDKHQWDNDYPLHKKAIFANSFHKKINNNVADIIVMKPSLFGVGVDIKELFKKIFQKK